MCYPLLAVLDINTLGRDGYQTTAFEIIDSIGRVCFICGDTLDCVKWIAKLAPIWY